jgi:hypothetical protein
VCSGHRNGRIGVVERAGIEPADRQTPDVTVGTNRRAPLLSFNRNFRSTKPTLVARGSGVLRCRQTYSANVERRTRFTPVVMGSMTAVQLQPARPFRFWGLHRCLVVPLGRLRSYANMLSKEFVGMNPKGSRQSIQNSQLRLEALFNGGEFLLADASKPGDLCLGEIAFASESANVAANVFKHDSSPAQEAVVSFWGVHLRRTHDSQNEKPKLRQHP